MITPGTSVASPEQGDLFEDRGTWHGRDTPPQDMGDEDLDGLSDEDLVKKTAKASLSNVQQLCAQIVARDLGDIAVPGLVALWNRFIGFGIVSALPEQKLALETLSAIGNDAAKREISKILAAQDLPDSLIPFALQAAVSVGLKLPQTQILPWLEHDAPAVRTQAFVLLQPSSPELTTLEIGFSDPDPSVRRAALTVAGNLGHISARAGLLAEFRRNPVSQTIEALLSVADDDIVVEIARYGLENSLHQTLIARELEALDTPKTQKLAQRINDQILQR
jgi:hypothetical protein